MKYVVNCENCNKEFEVYKTTRSQHKKLHWELKKKNK